MVLAMAATTAVALAPTVTYANNCDNQAQITGGDLWVELPPGDPVVGVGADVGALDTGNPDFYAVCWLILGAEYEAALWADIQTHTNDPLDPHDDSYVVRSRARVCANGICNWISPLDEDGHYVGGHASTSRCGDSFVSAICVNGGLIGSPIAVGAEDTGVKLGLLVPPFVGNPTQPCIDPCVMVDFGEVRVHVDGPSAGVQLCFILVRDPNGDVPSPITCNDI